MSASRGRVPDRFAALYEPAAMRLPVIPSLAMPHLPDPPPDVRNLSPHYRDHYGPNILREYPKGPDEDRIVVIDKAFPHSVFDLMLLAVTGDDTVIASSVSDVAAGTLRGLLTCCRQFVGYVQQPPTRHRFGLDGAQLMIGTNYDPATTDRDNGQWWDKRMHWHLNCWPRPAFANAQVVALGQVGDVTRRRTLLDPIAALAGTIMRDACRELQLPNGCTMITSQLAPATPLPVGFKIALPGWDFLTHPDCARLLTQLHAIAAGTYAGLSEAFTGSSAEPAPWTRPALLPARQVTLNLARLTWLSPPALHGLRVLRSLLRDVTSREMDMMRARMELANRCLTLAGLDYHLGFFSPPGPATSGRADESVVYVVMQFKLLSAVGSSPAIGGSVASILDRFAGPVMTPQQIAMRREFQDGFLATFDHHTQASMAVAA